jgi:hypothetical protein
MSMSGKSAESLNAAMDEALEEVLGAPDLADRELYGRLRTLIGNCVADNYDESDVRAVIQLAIDSDVLDAEEGED